MADTMGILKGLSGGGDAMTDEALEELFNKIGAVALINPNVLPVSTPLTGPI